MSLTEIADDVRARPLLPMPAAKALAVGFVGLFAFFAVWAFDANARISELTSKMEQSAAAQLRLADELRETNRLVQRMLGRLER